MLRCKILIILHPAIWHVSFNFLEKKKFTSQSSGDAGKDVEDAWRSCICMPAVKLCMGNSCIIYLLRLLCGGISIVSYV